MAVALKELRIEPRWDSMEAWQRPLALAEFYDNQAVIKEL